MDVTYQHFPWQQDRNPHGWTVRHAGPSHQILLHSAIRGFNELHFAQLDLDHVVSCIGFLLSK